MLDSGARGGAVWIRTLGLLLGLLSRGGDGDKGRDGEDGEGGELHLDRFGWWWVGGIGECLLGLVNECVV